MDGLKLVNLARRPRTIVPVGPAAFGAGFTLIAGPCSVESEEQTLTIAAAVKEAGAHALRGGAFKPRTSPYSFQGLGLRGLKILDRARRLTGLPVVSEVVDPRDVPWMCDYVDMLQIGARNMQNFTLLKEVGRTRTPVLLKRGMYSTLAELLSCAEYILNAGNPGVVLCERGIRTFEPYTRNTLDLSAVAALKELTHLPVIVDPAHGTGRLSLIEPMSLAAAACGADGIMVEVHHRPEQALSDKDQSLTPEAFARLARRVAALRTFMEREHDPASAVEPAAEDAVGRLPHPSR